MMVPLWTYGTLKAQRGDTTWGVAGYQLAVDKVAPCEEAPKKSK